MPGRRVEPERVAMSIVVEVAPPSRLPRCVERAKIHRATPVAALHGPVLFAARHLVEPENVGGAIAVEIADARDAPVSALACAEVDRLRPVAVLHLPLIDLAGVDVAPKDIGHA